MYFNHNHVISKFKNIVSCTKIVINYVINNEKVNYVIRYNKLLKKLVFNNILY